MLFLTELSTSLFLDNHPTIFCLNKETRKNFYRLLGYRINLQKTIRNISYVRKALLGKSEESYLADKKSKTLDFFFQESRSPDKDRDNRAANFSDGAEKDKDKDKKGKW